LKKNGFTLLIRDQRVLEMGKRDVVHKHRVFVVQVGIQFEVGNDRGLRRIPVWPFDGKNGENAGERHSLSFHNPGNSSYERKSPLEHNRRKEGMDLLSQFVPERPQSVGCIVEPPKPGSPRTFMPIQRFTPWRPFIRLIQLLETF
jgi:hypothetical protein